MNIAVSSCLLGEPCRYDGQSCANEAICALREQHTLIPVCPEQLGGLDTPRPPCELDSTLHFASVHTADGCDLTADFEAGAVAALEIAQKNDCKLALFADNSPSCGSQYVYDGSFARRLIPGSGIATRLFRGSGIRVLSQSMFEDCNKSALLSTQAADTPSLETKRFVLRPLTKDDAEAVFEYSRHPEVGPDAGWSPHRSIDDSLVFISAIASSPHVFGLVEKKTGRVVGSVGLIEDPMRKNPDALMLGYALGQPWWGKGYMTEAAKEIIRYGFCDLRLALITCNHYVFNSRSKRVIEKCGFKYEGILRSVEATPDGILQDTVCYSLTKQEFFSGGDHYEL